MATKKQGLSHSEYAKRRGITRPAIALAIKEGDCVLFADGSIDPAKSDPLMDARASRRKNTDTTVSQAGQINAAKLQKLSAQARQEQIRADELEGRLIPVNDVRQLLGQVLQILQVSMLGLPDSIAPRLSGLSVSDVQTTIDSEVRAILGRAADSLEAIPSSIKRKRGRA